MHCALQKKSRQITHEEGKNGLKGFQRIIHVRRQYTAAILAEAFKPA